MFKSFKTNRNHFNTFPNLNFQMNSEAYGFSGCNFWLDAAYGLNTQTDLAAVTKWTDRIMGFSFLQATAANQPRLVSSSASYNNLPVVDFYSNARFMQSPTFLNGTNVTYAIVANYDSLNDRNGILGNSIIVNGIGFGGSIAAITGFFITNNETTYFQGTTDSSSVKIIIATPNQILVNGVSEATGTNNVYNGPIDLIGRYANSTARALIGKIAEVIIFNNILDSTKVLQLSDRLNSKYAIY